MENMPCVRGAFDDFEKFRHALKSLKEGRIARYEAFGPTDLAEVEEFMPRQGSGVRVWATVGAVLGLMILYGLCVYSSRIFDLIVGGKPPISNLPFIIPAYEGTILAGSVMAFVAVLILAKFGDHPLSREYDPAYTEDTYGIHVYCGARDRDRVAEMLKDAGAVKIDEP